MIARPERRGRQLRRAAIAAARAQGCTCAVAATVQHDRDGFARIQVEHDDHCPLLRACEGPHGAGHRQVALVSQRFLNGGAA